MCGVFTPNAYSIFFLFILPYDQFDVRVRLFARTVAIAGDVKSTWIRRNGNIEPTFALRFAPWNARDSRRNSSAAHRSIACCLKRAPEIGWKIFYLYNKAIVRDVFIQRGELDLSKPVVPFFFFIKWSVVMVSNVLFF